MKIAYCTGFWCTNIGNGFFSLGVLHVLKKVFGEENVTVVSDYQTYTNCVGKRLYPADNQLHYLEKLDVDIVVLAGPVLSRYFLRLWKDTLLKLRERGVRYMIVSAGMMKLNDQEEAEICTFFKECPPHLLMSRDRRTYDAFAEYAIHAYDGICFSFFAPEVNPKAPVRGEKPYLVLNFDKIDEPSIWKSGDRERKHDAVFILGGQKYCLRVPAFYRKNGLKTDRFTDSLVYALSLLPALRRADNVGDYAVIRTDHRFYPHFRNKIYRYHNSFVSDVPYPYMELYANAECTLSDRVHACAVTLAYGNSAMLFSGTERVGLLERVGASEICQKVTRIDLEQLEQEKQGVISCLQSIAGESNQ